MADRLAHCRNRTRLTVACRAYISRKTLCGPATHSSAEVRREPPSLTKIGAQDFAAACIVVVGAHSMITGGFPLLRIAPFLV